jgi:hypothetical protein
MRRAAAAALLALLAVCCGEERPVPPDMGPTASPGRVKPLTSRENDSPMPSAQPGPPQDLPPGHPPIDSAARGPAATSGGAVTGTASLAPRLRDRRGRALFIIARSTKTGQILAVRKEDDPSFPHPFQISGADAMTEGTAFVGPFDITVRLSKTGDAMAGAGDVEGVAKGIATGADKVAVVLDTVRQ